LFFEIQGTDFNIKCNITQNIFILEIQRKNLVVILGDVKHRKVPIKMFEPKSNVVKTGLYKDEQEVLQCLLHNQAEQKINYYSKKIAQMKQKYDMDFSAFENRISLGAGGDDFEEWDDFTLWEGYVKAHQYWKQYL
jgi:hypothetical protein